MEEGTESWVQPEERHWDPWSTHTCTSTPSHVCTPSLSLSRGGTMMMKTSHTWRMHCYSWGTRLPSQCSGGWSVGGQPGSMAGPPAALESLGISQIEDSLHATLAGRGRYHHTPFRGEPESQTRVSLTYLNTVRLCQVCRELSPGGCPHSLGEPTLLSPVPPASNPPFSNSDLCFRKTAGLASFLLPPLDFISKPHSNWTFVRWPQIGS